MIHFPALSDYSPFTLTSPYHQPIAQKKTIAYRNLRDIDLTTFIKDISSSQLCTHPPDDFDVLVDMYNNTLQEILDNHALIQTKQVLVQQQAKWYNKNIVLAKKSRTKTEKKVSLHKGLNSFGYVQVRKPQSEETL